MRSCAFAESVQFNVLHSPHVKRASKLGVSATRGRTTGEAVHFSSTDDAPTHRRGRQAARGATGDGSVGGEERVLPRRRVGCIRVYERSAHRTGRSGAGKNRLPG